MEFDREEMRRELAKVRDEFTCSKNERAFLDEIREKLSVETIPFMMGKEICIQTGNTRIHQSDFTKCNLSELVEGKG